MSRPAASELTRALLARGGAGSAILGLKSHGWAVATFEGERHEIAIEVPIAAASAFAEGIEEAEFALDGHFVADIALVGRGGADDRIRLAIEALTMIAA